MSGTGRHLGVDIEWSLRARGDGAFVEELRSSQLRFRWGHPGTARGGPVWEVDDAGVSKHLVLDDHEAVLLATWVRTGYWLAPDVRERFLEVSLLPTHPPQEAASNGAPPAGDGSEIRLAPLVRPKQPEDEAPSSSGRNGGGNGTPAGTVVVSIRTRGGRLTNWLTIRTDTWEPVSLEQHVCGDNEVWRFGDWEKWPSSTVLSAVRPQDALGYPRHVHHHCSTGGQHRYRTTEVTIADPFVDAVFRIPPQQVRPLDTNFLMDIPAETTAWYASAGHLLVKPKINGKEVGYFLMDTGASGLVINRAAADELGLSSFGELLVSGMTSSVHCRFRRAATLQLGPMLQCNPLFMEMPMDGVVRNPPGTDKVVGILGYDVFRRAVMEFPVYEGDTRREYTLRLYDPVTYEPPAAVAKGWQPLQMVTNLPHTTFTFAHGDDGPDHQALFILDSGASGVDVMFPARSVRQFELKGLPESRNRFVRGVGGSTIQVSSARLSWMAMGEGRVPRVACLLAQGPGLDLSMYSSGILCGDMLARFTVVMDYPHGRVAIVGPDEQGDDADGADPVGK